MRSHIVAVLILILLGQSLSNLNSNNYHIDSLNDNLITESTQNNGNSYTRTNPPSLPTFESYAEPRLNVSSTILNWDDYVDSRSETVQPKVIHFAERSDDSILILLKPSDNGKLITNETYTNNDNILINVDKNGSLLSAKVFDSGKATESKRNGFNLFVDSPDMTNLTLIGIFTFPGTQSYKILNDSITIIGSPYHAYMDVLVALQLNSSDFSVITYKVINSVSISGSPTYGSSCYLGIYEETTSNNSEFNFVVEFSGNNNGHSGTHRCSSYDFDGIPMTKPVMQRVVRSHFIVSLRYDLTFTSIDYVSSVTSSTANGNTMRHPPPIFSSEGGWARTSWEGSDTSTNKIYYSNFDSSITGSVNLCQSGSQNLDIQADYSNGFVHLCAESANTNVSLLRINMSSGMSTKTLIGQSDDMISYGMIPISSQRLLLSINSRNGFQTNQATYYGSFVLEYNIQSGSISLAHPELNSEFHSSYNVELFPDYEIEGRPFYDIGNALLLAISPNEIYSLSDLKILEIDTDNDGIPDRLDAFPTERTQNSDSDNDGFGDNPSGVNGDDCIYQSGNSTMDLFGCLDTDGDGYSDANDKFINEPSQVFDKDGDGYGDNQSGRFGDACPLEYGESTRDSYGCPDADYDGWSDSFDVFKNDSSQWKDTDGDGYGDELNGFQGDACPKSTGTSTLDRFGCRDTDNDGWSDNGDALPENPTQWLDRDGDGFGENNSEEATEIDLFPSDGTQWNDTDGDGHGDNPYGTQGDWFPEDPARWMDSDRDATADEDDAFPNDGTQQVDSDGDGYGDNLDGNRGDAFPNDPLEWKDSDDDGLGDNADMFPYDPTQKVDRDGDGMGDNPMGIGADKFPDDATQWGDIDGDGYGDNQTGTNPDKFITDATQWADRDGDGYGDNPQGRLYDLFPDNPTQWEDDDEDGLGDNQSGTDADPFLNDFDNDGFNDSIDILPKLASPGDLDADGCLDEDDAFPENGQECVDTDGDGIGNNGDSDDDGDGWTDADEERLNTDPLSSSSKPVDSFEIVIPGTAVGLGAWDLIGIFGGVPLFAWISFGFATRNGRCQRYEELLKEATSRDKLEQVALRWEYSLMLRMLGPHQGIRLERLRAELDDKFENATFDENDIGFDQTSIVENEGKDIPPINQSFSGPTKETIATSTDDSGYEWFKQGEENWYRPAGSSDEWFKFEN
jgi:hypothetical protein